MALSHSLDKGQGLRDMTKVLFTLDQDDKLILNTDTKARTRRPYALIVDHHCYTSRDSCGEVTGASRVCADTVIHYACFPAPFFILANGTSLSETARPGIGSRGRVLPFLFCEAMRAHRSWYLENCFSTNNNIHDRKKDLRGDSLQLDFFLPNDSVYILFAR